MKYIFSALLFVHGLIHLMGFANAFGWMQHEGFTSEISPVSGIFWLLACVLFVAAGIAFLAKADWWYLIAMFAVLLSTFLIISAWNDAKFGTIANVIILAGAVIGFGISSFHRGYTREVQIHSAIPHSHSASLLTENDLTGLPEPVKKYNRQQKSTYIPKDQLRGDVAHLKLEF